MGDEGNITLGATNTTIVPNLTSGLYYTFKIQAVNSEGSGLFSQPNEIYVGGPPNVVKNLTATIGDSKIDVSWVKSEYSGDTVITGYQIETIEYSKTKPISPDNLFATELNGKIGLSWVLVSDPTDMGFADITGYKIEQLFPGQATTIVETPVNTYTAEGLTNGTNYRFKISSINSEGVSDMGTLSTTVAPQPEAPGQPTIQSVTAGNAELALNWSAPSDHGGAPIVHYKAEFAVDPYTVWPLTQQEDNIASTSTTFTFNSASGFNNINNDSDYRIRVYAKNSVGYGPASDWSSVVTPSIFSASGGAESNYTDDSGVYYKVHTFYSDSTLSVTGSKDVDFLIVAGGGAGGPGSSSGYEAPGGGAGGLIYKTGQTISNNNYSVIIGLGGNKSGNSSGGQGGDSSFNGNIAKGGGRGAWSGGEIDGHDGGSGGGGRHYRGLGGDAVVNSGDTLTENSTTANEVGVFGNKGGDNDHNNQHANNWGGGGGGAGSRGKHSNETTISDRCDGGIGKQYNISGSDNYYAGGGGGGGSQGTTGQGGNGGGGNAATGYTGYDGVPNTGGGGGGAHSSDSAHEGGNGGSGIVIIRYVV